ncbi:hypothetical protein [Microbulbifer variabilis]|uniref:hypothetical protein n=1 Tax=Microbulbifer variabilis TaxID=266805 RepID=UPI001CFEC90E|nr:hypothetical protein [Microbulbifer variabilis]
MSDSLVTILSSIPSSDLPNKPLIKNNSKLAADVAKSDQWMFGSSNLRLDANGEVRLATSAEVLNETRNSPSAMVQVLSTGADLLRFDANGYYQEDVDAIAALHAQSNKTPEEISNDVQQATVALRDKMREDIKKGVFSVNESGQAFHNGVEIPPESVGFELNALLIESLTDKVSELSKLKSQIASVDGWLQEALAENGEDEIMATFEMNTRVLVEENRTWSTGTSVPGSGGWKDSTEKMNHESMCKYKHVEHKSDFDKFALDNFPEMFPNQNIDRTGEALMDTLREAYEDLMSDSGLNLPAWWTEGEDAEFFESDWIRGPDLKDESKYANKNLEWETRDDGAAGGYKYRGKDQKEVFDKRMLNATSFTAAKENINSRVSTLSTLTEQLGTNLTVDNTRFNNLIEAMNNYNKSVLDSLKRFSVI